MEDLLTEIQKLLTNESHIETFPNITYAISSQDDSLKCMLKPHFPSPKYTHDYTTILITLNPVQIKITNSTIYITGKYSKMSRVLSQTPFKHASESVADFIVYFKEHYKADSVNFIGCGREDVDVQCYERPFMLEIINPKQNLEIHNVKVTLNAGVSIYNLKVVHKDYRKLFLTLNPNKVYKAKVRSNKFSNELRKGKLVIKQKTPTRVLHRRANLIRERNMEILEVIEDKEYYEFIIQADAGTYIKEFISGDFGRTYPSLSSINENICVCDCLDVIKILCEDVEEGHVISDVIIELFK